MYNSISSILRVAVSFVALLALATLGPAPIRGDKYNFKPHVLQPQDEKSLEAQQQHQVQMGQVGPPPSSHADVQMEAQPGAQDASTIMARAQRGGDNTPNASANQVLSAATARLEPSTNRTWLWALLILGTVIGGIVGVKRWADHHIPDAPTVVPKSQDW